MRKKYAAAVVVALMFGPLLSVVQSRIIFFALIFIAAIAYGCLSRVLMRLRQ